MRVVVGADHAGFELKQKMVGYLRQLGHDVIDKGTDSDRPVDYPDFAEAVGKAIIQGEGQRALLDLRQRGGRFGGGQQNSRRPGERLSRYVFGPPGRRT